MRESQIPSLKGLKKVNVARGGETAGPFAAGKAREIGLFLLLGPVSDDGLRTDAGVGADALKRYASASKATRQHIGAPRRLRYGATPIEGIDCYATSAESAPIQVFIHGGAWILEEAKNFAFPAEMFTQAGAHFLAVDFTNVRETNGDLMPLANQVRNAIVWIYKNAATFGGDPNRIYISGHSSGAHLASVAFTTNWAKDFALPVDIIKGGLFVSGMYDLKPVRLSARSKYVAFTDAIEESLSPQRHLEKMASPIVVAYGTQETPEFQRQARDFTIAARSEGNDVTLLVGEDFNHFEIIETLANPYGLLGRAALSQMGLSRM